MPTIPTLLCPRSTRNCSARDTPSGFDWSNLLLVISCVGLVPSLLQGSVKTSGCTHLEFFHRRRWNSAALDYVISEFILQPRSGLRRCHSDEFYYLERLIGVRCRFQLLLIVVCNKGRFLLLRSFVPLSFVFCFIYLLCFVLFSLFIC